MFRKYLDKLEFNIIVEQLLNNCKTFIGKQITSSLEPYSNKQKVETVLNETTEGCSLINALGSFPIVEIDDLSLPLKKIESNISLSAKYLLQIADVLKTSNDLKKYYKEYEFDLPLLEQYFNELYSNDNIEKKIFSSIISENEISDNASSKLSSIRRNRKNLEVEIKNKLNSILHSSAYSKYIMESVITIRNNRYVIPVKDEYRSKIKGFIHDTSSSGSTVYIEPMPVFEINNSINNLVIEENREIERILEELSSLLYPIYNSIAKTINIIGKLDFISAKAKFSIDNDCVMPQIKNYIDLKNARHPLINKNSVVPISIYLGKKDNGEEKHFTTLVITGPNTGGKTVTLKTVGLLCIMAQSGLHIPASEGSSIKIFDNIFADIGDEQSIEESLSTFSSHITNIVEILKTYTKNSLILVDELGSGTDPIEGANLAISLLETFHNKGCFTIATTHYHEIKNYCITHDDYENASCEFDIKTLKPTYHILIGIPGNSNAFAISKELGISSDIIDRASSLMNKTDVDIEDLLKEIYDNKKIIEQKENEISKNLIQIEHLRKELEKDYSDKLNHEKEKIEKAKSEAKQILLDAKEEANSIINDLSKMKKSDSKKANELRNKLNSSINELGNDGIDLSVLLKLNNKETETLNSNTNSKKSVHITNTKAKDTSTEINLIGETVVSAVETLDKYLDNCLMAGIHQVRIIHGKGSGKLRQGIHQYLKTSKYVADFKIADYGEGDYGVTIAYLK